MLAHVKAAGLDHPLPRQEGKIRQGAALHRPRQVHGKAKQGAPVGGKGAPLQGSPAFPGFQDLVKGEMCIRDRENSSRGDAPPPMGGA